METIKRQDIKGETPKDAQFAKLNPSGDFIEKFYKINEHEIPMYYGEQGGWHGSFSHTKDSILKSPLFLQII